MAIFLGAGNVLRGVERRMASAAARADRIF
jgi:hypothetical protein